VVEKMTAEIWREGGGRGGEWWLMLPVL